MSTPIEPLGPTEYTDDTPRATPEEPREIITDETLRGAPPPEITPDNPPWGVLGGFGLWLASIVLMVVSLLVFLIPYLIQQRVRPADMERVITDPTAVFLQIVSVIPAHLLTLGVAWLIVTGVGKRSFFRGLGWEWGAGFNLWRCVALAFGLLALGYAVIYLTGNPETPMDKAIKTSRAAAITTAFLATFTAPLVEEVVYRGVLFSGLRKYLGAAWSGLLVVLIFAAVHVPQYWGSVGTIAIILLLSAVLTIIRARTGQLLPCFVIHLVFNGVQSILIVAEPYLQRLAPETPPLPAPDPALVLSLFGLFG